MKKIIVSAPGKLMLFGEHAVVYGHPCIVTAVDQRLFVTISLDARRSTLTVNAPDVDVKNYSKPLEDLGKGDIPKGTRFIEFAVRNLFDYLRLNLVKADKVQPWQEGLRVSTRSEFSSLFGFGSSSASTVCVIKALSELFDLHLTNKQIFDLAYKTVLDIQGKGSGFDVAAAIYGGTLYFVTGGKVVEQLIPVCHSERSEESRGPSAKPQDDKKNNLPLIVGYSGIKADTVTLINKVSERSKKNPVLVNNIYENMDKIVEIAKVAIEKQDWEQVGKLMNENQKLLVLLGVSIDKLDAMIYAANNAGAYGAKLSGAGGGDCMIALRQAQGKLAVEEAIEKVGGKVIDIETNAEGVRIEDQISKIKDKKQVQK